MNKIDDLKTEIERLPSEEFAELFRWLSEKEWERWDRST
jgi:transcriptional regulator with AAA-type ATPase domain